MTAPTSRTKFTLQVIVAIVLLLGAALATGVVKVVVKRDPVPTVHRVSQ